jgi:hypothetical protein
MAKGKVGTGSLTPFKAGSTGSETISNTVGQRSGFFDKYDLTKASRNVTELTAFKTGPESPGRNTNPDHPSFISSGPKIKTLPPFKE